MLLVFVLNIWVGVRLDRFVFELCDISVMFTCVMFVTYVAYLYGLMQDVWDREKLSMIKGAEYQRGLRAVLSVNTRWRSFLSSSVVRGSSFGQLYLLSG